MLAVHDIAACGDGLQVLPPWQVWRVCGPVRLEQDAAALQAHYTVVEVAALLSCDRKTVQRMCAAGRVAWTWAPRPHGGPPCVVIQAAEVTRLLLEYPGRPGYGAARSRRGGRPWTPEEIAELESRETVRELGARLGRSCRSVTIKRCRERARRRCAP
jgi:hypothetical protein